jgi:hypothetical protein
MRCNALRSFRYPGRAFGSPEYKLQRESRAKEMEELGPRFRGDERSDGLGAA